MAKFCSECGTALGTGDRFCTSCGAAVVGAAHSNSRGRSARQAVALDASKARVQGMIRHALCP